MARRKHVQGLTLIELMIGVVIVSVVLGFGIPAFDGLLQSSRSTSEFNRFVGDIVFARSEAVKRGTAVTLCASTNGANCAGTNWAAGWVVRVGAGDVLRVGSPTGGVNIAASGFANNGSISFSGDGRLEGGVAANIGRFVFCDAHGASSAKGISFSPFGQHRKMRDTDADGIVDYVDGATQNVSC